MYGKEIDILNYVDIYPLTKDILVCIINKNEIVKADELFVELLPQEVSCINTLMMRYADRYCIGDLSRYKSNIHNDLNNVKVYEEKFLEILEEYKIIKWYKKNN